MNKKMKEILTDLIHRKEEGMKKGELSSDDLLGLLLQSNRDGDSTKSSALTIDEVIEECKLFYIAGEETTSSLITWTLILLAMNPIWQEEAREEIVRICGKNPADYECISRLKIVSYIFIFLNSFLGTSFSQAQIEEYYLHRAYTHAHGPHHFILSKNQGGAWLDGSQFTLVLWQNALFRFKLINSEGNTCIRSMIIL